MTEGKNQGIYYAISGACGVIVASVGLFALIGWILNVPLMKSVLPGLVTMKANTAICFILSGLSLWSLQVKRIDKKNIRVIGNICAYTVILVGALTLYEYLFGKNLGIDQLFFSEPPGAVFTTYPGRMAFITAFDFFALGIALLLLNVKTRFAYYSCQSLALTSGLVALSALCGYVYGVSTFYGGIAIYTAMALHTVVAFILLCLGLLLARPREALSGVFTAEESGGIMIRRILPVIIVTPILLGRLMLLGEKAGMYDVRFGVATMVITVIALLSAVVWWSAASINDMEKKRLHAQTALDAANEEWKATFDAMSDPAFVMDTNNNIVNANSATIKFLGKPVKDIIGKKCYEIMHGTTAPINNCPMERSKNNGKSNTEEVNDPHIGIPLIVTTSPIRNDKNEIVGFVHVAKDISAIKRYADDLKGKIEELERFQKISVGRELRMKELKSRIAQLEAMLSSRKEQG